jgi:hypothetical protein
MLSRVTQSLHVQVYVTCVAIIIHNVSEKQSSIHRDTMETRISSGTSLIWMTLCLIITRKLLQTSVGGKG